MCLELKQIRGYLHHYAAKFQNNTLEHWELVNEAWIKVHSLNNIEFASQGIKWAMIQYRDKMYRQRKRRNLDASITSIDADALDTLCRKDLIFDTLNCFKDIDNIDQLTVISRNLSLDERLLIDQRYYQELKLKEIAYIHGVKKQAIAMRLAKIIEKMKRIAA